MWEDYPTAMFKLDEYFMPKKNIDYIVFHFRQASQQSGDTVNQFITCLCKLVALCEFADLNKEFKAAVILYCQSKRLHQFELREDMTLDKLVAKARALETSESQASEMESSCPQSSGKDSVHHINEQKQSFTKHPVFQSTKPNSICHNCGFV